MTCLSVHLRQKSATVRSTKRNGRFRSTAIGHAADIILAAEVFRELVIIYDDMLLQFISHMEVFKDAQGRSKADVAEREACRAAVKAMVDRLVGLISKVISRLLDQFSQAIKALGVPPFPMWG